MRVILGILAVLIVAALGGVVWLYSGAYPVAATERHTALGTWVLETAKRQSVRNHARGTAVPPLGDFRLVEEGARLFEGRCALCHGSPGSERQGFASAMNPAPPSLSDVVGRWTSAELHWITRHGLRMTGMPAWSMAQAGGLTDGEIWSVVALLNQLPTMDAERYRAIVAHVPSVPPPEERPGAEELPAEELQPTGESEDGMVPPTEEPIDEDEPGDPPQPQLQIPQQQSGANPGPRPMRLIP